MKKIIAFVLCCVIVFGGVSCTSPFDGDTEGETEMYTDTSSNTVYELTYDDIIGRYTTLLKAKLNGEVFAEPSDFANTIEKTLSDIVRDVEDPSIMGYATKDINGDGDEELVLLSKSNKLYALFTVQNTVPVLLLKLDTLSAAIAPDGTVYTYQYVKDQGDHTQIKKIIDGELVGIEYDGVINGESVTYYKTENGVKTEITQEEKKLLGNSLESIMLNPMYINKTTGFRFVSAIPETAANKAPIPDFTTYDGIIAAYKTIVESFSEYKKLDWINGKFDNLFTITDNESYEVFHQIFQCGINNMPTEEYLSKTYASDGDNSYGYAKKDINGDGMEELILLNDKYEIISLFTEKNGRAHLVDGVCHAWIDENGNIRKEIATGGQVSRDGECCVYTLDGTTLKTEIAVGYKVNIYLQKEGWYKIEDGKKIEIPEQEGESLYTAYDILPSRYSDNEYTRTFADIEFIPLFDATEAGEKHVGTFTNAWFIYGDAITVSSFTTDDVTAVIKFIYTEGEFDPETNPEPVQYITELNVRALRFGNRYTFEQDGIKGYIEFAVGAVWVVVTESQNEHVDDRAYLFDRPHIN